MAVSGAALNAHGGRAVDILDRDSLRAPRIGIRFEGARICWPLRVGNDASLPVGFGESFD